MNTFYTFMLIILLISMLPLYAVVVLLVVFASGLPVFYTQRRIGKNNKSFTIYKFRTMVPGAERLQKKLSSKNEADGPVFKIHNDPRYTSIGKLLAHIGLDELPQLWNVFKGDMALFGPRPLPVYEAKRLKKWQMKRHSIRPGIISPAVLTGQYHEDFNAWMRDDIDYLQKKSILYDLSLLWGACRLLVRLLLREIGIIL